MAGLPTLGLPHGALKKRTSHVLMKRTCRTLCQEESAPSGHFSVEIGLVLIGFMGLPRGVPPAGAGGAPAGLAVCAPNAPRQGQDFICELLRIVRIFENERGFGHRECRVSCLHSVV